VKKIIAILIVIVIITSLLSFGTAAYGSADKKLIITHINDSAGLEGVGIIYTSDIGTTLGVKGTFDWWTVITFEWDDSANAYVVKRVNKAMNSSKGDTVIPQNGFVYCVNTGNDWPSLYKQNPTAYAAYKGSPCYVTTWGKNSNDYAGNLTIGTKVYLYGTDLLNVTIRNNGKYWYDADYVSESYIKVGEPDGDDWYNPKTASEKDVFYDVKINRIGHSYDEGIVTLLTRKNTGVTIDAKGYTFNWWKTATFDWDDSQGCYVCVSKNVGCNGNAVKNTVIPANGFVLLVNTGNNYSSSGGINYTNSIADYAFSTVEALKVGSKAYLSGIDLASNTATISNDKWYDRAFTSDAHVYIGELPSGKTAYTPTVTDRLATPKATVTEDKETFTVSWDAVADADGYTFTLYDSSVCTEGKAIIKNVDVNTNSYTINRSSLTVGYNYTFRITATANGKSESMACFDSFYVYSQKAASSPYRDKTIVAFGDSVTAFTGWVGMLTGEIGTQVINSGVGGDNTFNAVSRLQKDVIDYDPDIVILNFGMNDQAVSLTTGNPLVSTADYEKNYRTIIEACQTIGARVILVTVHYVCTDSGYYVKGGYGIDYGQHDNWDKYVEVQKKLAAEYSLERIPINEYSTEVGYNVICAQGDGIHLSSKGQEYYTKWISEYLFANVTSDPIEESNAESSDEVSDESPEQSIESSDANESSQITQSESDTQKPTNNIMLFIIIGVLALAIIVVIIAIIIKKK